MKRLGCFVLGLGLVLWAGDSKAVDYITSTSCTVSGASACNVNGCFVCNGSAWVPQSLIVGTSSTCDTAHKGLIAWNSTKFQGCDGSAWVDLGIGTSAEDSVVFW